MRCCVLFLRDWDEVQTARGAKDAGADEGTNRHRSLQQQSRNKQHQEGHSYAHTAIGEGLWRDETLSERQRVDFFA